MKGSSWAALAAVSAAWLSTTAPALAGQAPAGDAARGKTLMVEHTCSFCHGTEGQGAGLPAVGARIGPPSRAVAGFKAFVRRPSGGMPSFSDTVVSERDLDDIYAYLRTIPRPKPASAIPLLNALKAPAPAKKPARR